MDCYKCGEKMFITADGTSHHSSDDGDGVDYEADADHVALDKGQVVEIGSRVGL